ncbi:transmembrane protein 248 [Daphnia magna]|uniref:Uncharacterized protein n=2 Tax=Daphnia magna TaxID=35525 RepID=A0ABR0AZF6_9CRUS|nr:transmembrane protein 248 [Daphnia magna]XP_032794108.1 transmembrane protein 248 [Daphnia magna]KAK4030513.1 hypothetical protein OUZ56_023756 [Daphnia magna]KZS21207.1 Uncharacterized protein APZ42_011913 [Daphnia magna]
MKRMSWTFRVPFQNIKNFVVSRPPAVIFAFCIASFGIVTLCLSLYIKHTSSPLKNPDEKGWNDVAVKMNKLNMCLLAPGVSPSINTTGMEAASVPFEMMLPVHEIWKNFTVISGSIAAIDLGLRDHIGTNLSFSLSLMQSQNKLCLNLYHPWFVSMPHGAPTCNSLQFNPFPKSIGAFVLPREDKKLTTGSITPKCADNSAFDVKLLENPAWTVLLGKEERARSSHHLMVASLFLLASFFTILCFAAVRGGSSSKPIKISNPGRIELEDKEPLAP